MDQEHVQGETVPTPVGDLINDNVVLQDVRRKWELDQVGLAAGRCVVCKGPRRLRKGVVQNADQRTAGIPLRSGSRNAGMNRSKPGERYLARRPTIKGVQLHA